MSRFGYIALGTVMCLFGGVLVWGALDSVDLLGDQGTVTFTLIGYSIAGFGSLLILVGVIATGVVVGMRDHADEERRLYAETEG